jgi:hypothetical protein
MMPSSETGNEQIEEAIVVVVSHGNCPSPAVCSKPSFGRHILELACPQVGVQDISPAFVDDQQIDVAVTVDIAECYVTALYVVAGDAHHLRDFLERPIHRVAIQSVPTAARNVEIQVTIMVDIDEEGYPAVRRTGDPSRCRDVAKSSVPQIAVEVIRARGCHVQVEPPVVVVVRKDGGGGVRGSRQPRVRGGFDEATGVIAEKDTARLGAVCHRPNHVEVRIPVPVVIADS